MDVLFDFNLKKCNGQKTRQMFPVIVAGCMGSGSASAIESETERILRAMSE